MPFKIPTFFIIPFFLCHIAIKSFAQPNTKISIAGKAQGDITVNELLQAESLLVAKNLPLKITSFKLYMWGKGWIYQTFDNNKDGKLTAQMSTAIEDAEKHYTDCFISFSEIRFLDTLKHIHGNSPDMQFHLLLDSKKKKPEPVRFIDTSKHYPCENTMLGRLITKPITKNGKINFGLAFTSQNNQVDTAKEGIGISRIDSMNITFVARYIHYNKDSTMTLQFLYNDKDDECNYMLTISYSSITPTKVITLKSSGEISNENFIKIEQDAVDRLLHYFK